MAVDLYGIKNQPYFDESKPGNTGPDLGAISDYAAANGNTKVGLHADRVALTGNDLWSHLEFVEKDTKTRWLYNGTGWVLLNQGRTSFTPTLQYTTTGTGSASSGYYRVVNGVVIGKVSITFGTGGGVSGGNFGLTPPVSVGSGTYRSVGTWTLFDASGIVWYTGSVLYDGTYFFCAIDGGQKINGSSPVVIAANDLLSIDFTYETSNTWS